MITKIAIKFVNAMWATQFARILSTGMQQYTRTVTKYNANKSGLSTAN